MGTFKNVARGAARKAAMPSESSEAMLNRAGGVAFDIKDAATKLVTMTGGAFFAEPKYYEGTLEAKRSTGDNKRFEKLVARLAAVDGKLGSLNAVGLDDTSREVLATAVSVANSDHPEDLLIIANWLRNAMNIRLTPQILLAVASGAAGCQPFVRKYAPKIAVRPDDIKSALTAFRFLYGPKTLKHCLGTGLGDTLAGFSEKALLKYDGADWPTWKDVIQWLPRKKGWPLKKGLQLYFLKGEVVDAADTPIAAMRTALAKKKNFDAEAKELVIKSGANWEVVLSQFAGDTGGRKAVWEFLIQNNLVGYMALLRNLRNILEADVSTSTIAKVAAKLADPEEVVKSRQLPFRFLSALKAIEGTSIDTHAAGKLVTGVKKASNAAALNIPELPGLTVIFCDVSASMNQVVSAKSQVTCKDAGTMLCGIVAARAKDSYVVAFGTDVAPVMFSGTDTVLDIAEKARDSNTKGCSTNGYRCVEFLCNLAQRGIFADRAIFISDMQMWNDSNSSDDGKCVADLWPKYLKMGKQAAKTWLHCIHINGYGDSVVDQMARVNQVGGFSEKVFSTLLEAEGTAEKEGVPTIEQIRRDWSVA